MNTREGFAGSLPKLAMLEAFVHPHPTFSSLRGLAQGLKPLALPSWCMIASVIVTSMQEVTTTREGAGGRAGHGQRPRTEQRGAGGAAASRLSERRGPSDYLGTRTLRAPQINSHQPHK